MASITIRNLDDGVKSKLRVRAATNGRSMEEEARTILREAVEREDFGKRAWDSDSRTVQASGRGRIGDSATGADARTPALRLSRWNVRSRHERRLGTHAGPSEFSGSTLARRSAGARLVCYGSDRGRGPDRHSHSARGETAAGPCRRGRSRFSRDVRGPRVAFRQFGCTGIRPDRRRTTGGWQTHLAGRLPDRSDRRVPRRAGGDKECP